MGTDPALAEYLPVLYRVALDAVDELARRGGRTEAARLRTKAGRAYSRAWDERCRRALEEHHRPRPRRRRHRRRRACRLPGLASSLTG